LVDGNHLIVGEQINSGGVKLRQISSKIKRCIGHGPKRDRRLLLNGVQTIVAVIADLQRAQVIPTGLGTGICLPSDEVTPALRSKWPTGKRRTVPLALQVATDPSSVCVLLPRVEIVLIDGPGNREPNRPMALRDSLAPSHHVRPVINRQCSRPRSNTIETNEVDAPGSKHRDDGVDILLRSLLGEVDLEVREGADRI